MAALPNNQVKRRGSFAPLSANAPDDDKIVEAGEAAELLFYRGLSFCARVLSDGVITDNQLPRGPGVGMVDAKDRAETLVRVGLWERLDNGYRIRGWLKWNSSREEIEVALEADRRRKGGRARGTPPPGPPGPGTPTAEPAESEVTEAHPPPDSVRNPNGVRPESHRSPAAVHPDSERSPEHTYTYTDTDTDKTGVRGGFAAAAPAREGTPEAEPEPPDPAGAGDTHRPRRRAARPRRGEGFIGPGGQVLDLPVYRAGGWSVVNPWRAKHSPAYRMAVYRDLAERADALLAAGAPPELVTAALEAWDARPGHASPGLLPHLYDDAVRATRTRPETTLAVPAHQVSKTEAAIAATRAAFDQYVADNGGELPSIRRRTGGA